jgi:uncharacterized protein (TIGR02246 family)
MTRLVPSLALLASALLAGCQTMGAAPNLTEVEAVERARFQTWVRGDAAAMQVVMADDVLYCHSNGECQTRNEFVTEIASKKRVYKKMDSIAMKPKALGSGAVMINGTVDVVAELQGRVVQFRAIYTSVYVKRDGGWRLLSWQSTTLP